MDRARLGRILTEINYNEHKKLILGMFYDGNGNTGGSVPVDGDHYMAGVDVTVGGNTGGLVREGYSFTGWNTASNGSGTDRNTGSTFIMGPENMVLYAKWAPVYTVTYFGNGATGGSVPVDGNHYLAGAGVTVAGNSKSLTKAGYTFTCWTQPRMEVGRIEAPGLHFQWDPRM